MSSTPRSWHRRSPRAGASPTRCRRCDASGGRCRSSPWPSSASSSSGRCSTSRSSGSTSAHGAWPRRSPSRSSSSVWSTGRASPRAASPATSPASSASCRPGVPVATAVSRRLRPVAEHRRCRRPELRHQRRCWQCSPRASSPRCRSPSRRGRGRPGSPSPRCGPSPACSILPLIGWIADAWTIRIGMLVMLPLFLHRQRHPRQYVRHDRRRHRPGVDGDGGAQRGAAAPAPGRCRAADRPPPRRRLRRPAGAVRRRHGHPRGPDRRPPRHQRRRQEHAAEVDQRGRRGRRRGDRPRRPGHHPRPAERDRRPRRRPGAGRRRRVRRADRRREPATGRLDAAPRPRRRAARRPSRCWRCSRCSATVPMWPRPTSAAASSRCSPSPWRSSPGRGCCSSTSSRSASRPVVVGQLLPVVQRLAADGVAVVLVEQSVNVALTIADRAYFMERGTIRFSGADRRPARATGPAAVGVPERRGRDEGIAVGHRAGGCARRPCRARADPPLRRHPGGRRGDVRRPRAGDRRRDRSQRRGQDDDVRPRVRVHPRRRRAHRARRPRHHDRQPVGAGRRRARAQLPGRPAVPGDDGAGDAGGGDGALGRQPQRPRRGDAPAGGLRRRGAHDGAAPRS